MGVYIAVRFEPRFRGVGAAVLALLHDVMVAVGAPSLVCSVWSLDLTTVAALLTIVGYSVNDTVVTSRTASARTGGGGSGRGSPWPT